MARKANWNFKGKSIYKINLPIYMYESGVEKIAQKLGVSKDKAIERIKIRFYYWLQKNTIFGEHGPEERKKIRKEWTGKTSDEVYDHPIQHDPHFYFHKHGMSLAYPLDYADAGKGPEIGIPMDDVIIVPSWGKLV